MDERHNRTQYFLLGWSPPTVGGRERIIASKRTFHSSNIETLQYYVAPMLFLVDLTPYLV